MAYDQYLQEFYDLLDACNNSDITQKEKLEAELWQRFGAVKTVLILDMAGFTTKVQKYGLIFFLRKIRYMQQVVRPLLEQWNGQLVKFEADNSYAVFQHSTDAVHCALKIHQAFKELADGSPEVDDVIVSIGLARGKILWIPDHDFFGDAVNLASKLGEDIANHGETLVSSSLFPELAQEPLFEVIPLELSISGLSLQAGKVQYHLK